MTIIKLFQVITKQSQNSYSLWLPKSNQTVLAIGANQILMRMMCYPYNILLVDLKQKRITICHTNCNTYVQSPLQLSRISGKAIQNHVFSHTIDPITPRGHRRAYEITSFSLTARKRPYDLTKRQVQNRALLFLFF